MGPNGTTSEGSAARSAMFFVALFGALGAVVAIQDAIITTYTACDYAGCHRPGRYYIQLVVAVPVGFMVWAAFTHRLGLALVLLAMSLATYRAWGLLNDAAVHPGPGKPARTISCPKGPPSRPRALQAPPICGRAHPSP
jgi:heme A synthase